MSLAAALVAIAENDVTEDLDRDVATVSRDAWGALLGSSTYNRAPHCADRNRSLSELVRASCPGTRYGRRVGNCRGWPYLASVR